MGTKTLADFMAGLDEVASRSSDKSQFWETVGAALQIWRHGIPAAEWDPRVNDTLAPIYSASRRYGAEFREAVDRRVFATA